MLEKKYLLFDFDGTIADSFKHGLEIYNQVAPWLKLMPINNEKEFSLLRDKPSDESLIDLGITGYKLPLFYLSTRYLYSKQIERVPVFPGLKTCLIELKHHGYELILLSANTTSNLRKFLAYNEIDVFTKTYGNLSMYHRDKAITKICRRLKIPINQCTYIGDEIRDINAAKKLNMKMIAVAFGGFNSRQSLLNAHPPKLIDTPQQLLVELTGHPR